MFTRTRTTKAFAATFAALMLLMFFVMPLVGCTKSKEPAEEPTVIKYTVSFDSNGGSAVKSQTVEKGSKAQEPDLPVKSGNSFGGWYKDSKFKVQWDFEHDTVDAEMTLYAKWTPAGGGEDIVGTTEYKVTFDSKGGSRVPQQTVKSGERAEEPTAPERDNYVFEAWCSDSACTEFWDFATDTVDSNITLYAKWRAEGKDSVTVTFNVGRDARIAGASNPPAQTVMKGEKVTAPTVSLTGCVIDGWYVENGTKKWDFKTDKLTDNTTLFARWSGTFPSLPSDGGNSETEEDEPEPDDYDPPEGNAGSLYIHYLRSDGAYDGWHIWAWTSTGKWFEKSSEDKSGAIYEIPLGEINATTQASFLVVLNTWDKKDGEDDNSIDLSKAQKKGDSYHWYVQSGRVGKGTAFLAKPANGEGNVNRSFAKNLPVQPNATGTDDMGVGYQVFVASFCDSDGDGMGDIRGIINKLGYFQSLNVDVLWLTPIQSSNSYHGYDCYDYYAIDPKFGTNADYRELTYKAHQRGIKIIMDLVVNHTSPQNEWFIKSKNNAVETITYRDGTKKTVHYRNYYRWRTSSAHRYYSAGDGKYFYSSFGNGMPELNYDYQETRDAMADVAKYWLEYGLDGFRMDAIKHMFMWDESDHTGDVEGRPEEAKDGYNFNLTKDVEWFKEFNYRLKSVYPHCFLLGENLTGDIKAVAPFYAGMDSLFDFNTFYDLGNKIRNDRAGDAAAAFNENAQSYAAARNGVGRAINSMITSNHDVARLAYAVGRSVDRQKQYFAVIMTLPGLSWIYYGDEIGMYSEEGDDKMYRQPMKWSNDWANKALPREVTNKHYDDSLAGASEQDDDPDSLLSYVKALTAVRHANPALINGTAVCSTSDGMLKITVTAGDTVITSYHNFSSSNKTATAAGNVIFGTQEVRPNGTVIYSNK